MLSNVFDVLRKVATGQKMRSLHKRYVDGMEGHFGKFCEAKLMTKSNLLADTGRWTRDQEARIRALVRVILFCWVLHWSLEYSHCIHWRFGVWAGIILIFNWKPSTPDVPNICRILWIRFTSILLFCCLKGFLKAWFLQKRLTCWNGTKTETKKATNEERINELYCFLSSGVCHHFAVNRENWLEIHS